MELFLPKGYIQFICGEKSTSKAELLFHLLQKMGLNVCVQKESKYAWEWNLFVEINSTVFASQNSRGFPLCMKSM
jgi:hypothetical protein